MFYIPNYCFRYWYRYFLTKPFETIQSIWKIGWRRGCSAQRVRRWIRIGYIQYDCELIELRIGKFLCKMDV